MRINECLTRRPTCKIIEAVKYRLVTKVSDHRRDMWTLEKLKGKEGGGGETKVKKKEGREEERSKRRHHGQSDRWSVDERRERLVSRSLHHRREWGWSEDVGLDRPGSSWVKTFEDTFEKTQWRAVQANVGWDQPDRCWVKLGHPPRLSYLSVSTGENWRRERADK